MSVHRAKYVFVYASCIAMILLTYSCEEAVIADTVRSIRFSGVEASIYGGEFIRKGREVRSDRVILDFTPQSLTTHIDLLIEDCSPYNINMRLGRNMSRFDVKVRAYLESEEQSRFNEGTVNQYVTKNGKVFRPVSDVYHLRHQINISTESDLDNPFGRFNAWNLTLSRGNNRFSVTPVYFEEKKIGENVELDEEVPYIICAQEPEDESRRLLVRQEVSYQYEGRFELAFLHYRDQRDTLDRLQEQLEQLEDQGVDGVSIAYRLPTGKDTERLSEFKSILSTQNIFWLTTPTPKRGGELNSWRYYFGGDNFSFEMSRVRLMFLNTSQTTLSSQQLGHVREWISDEAPSPYISNRIHTRALITHTPLVNLEGGRELSYRPGALRVLNELRRAHMTHQIIDRSAFSDETPRQRSELGTQVLLSPSSSSDQILILSIDPNCDRDVRGERCFEHRWLD